MGRAWVLCVPPTPAGPGPGPPFLCGVAPGQQRCSGQGGEVGLLARVGFLGVSLFSKHFSVLFAVCGTLGEMCRRGEVTPRGPRCPLCPPGSVVCCGEGQEAMGQGMAGPALSHGPRGSWSGCLCLVPGQSFDPPTSSCPPHRSRLCPPGSADRGPVRACASL